MAIDPSIPLQVNTDFPSMGPQQMLSLYSMAQAIKGQQAEMAKQNALKSVFQSPDAVDKDGIPTGKAIAQAYQIDPNVGIGLSEQVAGMETKRNQAKIQQSELYTMKADKQSDVVSSALEAHDEAVAAGLPETEAKKRAQEVMSSGFGDLKKSGLFSDDETARWPTEFDPAKLSAGQKKYHAWKEKQKADELAAKKEAEIEKRDEQRFQLQEKHESNQESIEKSRLGLEAKRVGIEAAREARESRKQAAMEAGGLNEDAIEGAAQRLVAGDNSALANIGRGAQGAKDIRAIENRAYSLAKQRGIDGKGIADAVAGFQGEKAGARTAGVRAASLAIAANEAQGALSQAEEAARDVPRSSFTPFNKAFQKGQEAFSDPKLARFQTALNAAVNTYARAISPTGTPTVSDKEHAREILSTADGPEAFKARVKQLQREIAVAQRAVIDVQTAQRSGYSGPGGESASRDTGGWKIVGVK